MATILQIVDFLHEKCYILIQMSLKFVPMVTMGETIKTQLFI